MPPLAFVDVSIDHALGECDRVSILELEALEGGTPVHRRTNRSSDHSIDS
jgi:hypothetical protein